MNSGRRLVKIWKPWFRHYRKMLVAAWLGIVLLVCVPGRALASSDDTPEVYDARLQGYAQKVELDSSSTALTWLVLIVLGVLSLGVLFKDAKRSHLD